MPCLWAALRTRRRDADGGDRDGRAPQLQLRHSSLVPMVSTVRVRATRAVRHPDYAAFVESFALGLRPGVLRSLARVPPTCAYSVESRPK